MSRKTNDGQKCNGTHGYETWHDLKTDQTCYRKKKPETPYSLRKRGAGKTKLTALPVLAPEKTAICMLRGEGLSDAEIGKKLKRPPAAIAKERKKMEKEVAAAGLPYSWREDMEVKAVAALNAGLDCVDDPYKRGTLGLGAAKGLGLMAADSVVNVAALINAVPEGHRERYVTLEPQAEQIPEEASK